ncbi:o-succinylbenzoate synthase [uncultured Corynebacterium sp.]|uniref:o-succinylbenzoate synthase n=1 Tax=uncultured Corynebacterium sp. TaxID=159447 RepID=UPI00260111C6|nr:o-succinylbenzoate synthase [uncultured Corynebacterium sp.]
MSDPVSPTPADPFPLPDPSDLLDRAHVVALPLRTRFRGVDVREVMLFDAPGGWVEWSPFPEYGAEEASRWLRCTLELGWGAPPEPVVDSVEVNATIPAVDVRADGEAVAKLLERYPGCTTVKIKVAERGQDLDDDVARVAAVREWFGDRGIVPRIRVDANGGWTPDEAVTAIGALTRGGPLDYAEQPCRTVDELAEVRRRLARSGVFARIAADELIRKADDPLAVVRAGACDVAVVKAAPLGGVSQVLRVAEDIAGFGVPVTVSSALESAVGMGAGLRAAAALPRLHDDEGLVAAPNAAGLATGSLFDVDVAARPIVDGRIAVGPVTPDPAVLAECAATTERRDRWFRRLETALDVLG